MRFVCFTVLFLTAFTFAASPAKADSAELSETLVAAQDTIVDTIYVIQESGIPWNRENFDPERLVRHDTFDPALKVAYTYSVSFIGGSFGSFAQQSFMAHFAYEFTPNLHLYANVGLWMPLYSSIHFGNRIAREDVNDKVSLKVMYINERDAFRAYGPHRYFYDGCPWSNPRYCW